MPSDPRKLALVTGANADLGLPIVQRLLVLGYRIVGQYHSNPGPLAHLPPESFVPFRADLTRPEEACALVERAADANGGRIDALVHLVGPFDHRHVFEFTPEEWSRAVQLNLNTAFNVIHFARAPLIAARGRVICFNYAGVENIRALPEATAYAAAKAGLAVLVKSLAAAFAEHGVSVSAVAPGWIDHPGFGAERREAIARAIPARRLGSVSEVVQVVEWLVAHAPFYATGATHAVGGAWEL